MQEIYCRLESALGAESVPGLAPGASDIFSAAALLSQGAGIYVLLLTGLNMQGQGALAAMQRGRGGPLNIMHVTASNLVFNKRALAVHSTSEADQKVRC